MKPLVEATVFDETGSMRATFFNQPWLAQRYKPGTRLVLHGRTTERGTFNVSHHALGTDLGAEEAGAPDAAGGEIAHYPASEGVSSTQILTLVQSARDALADVPEALSASAQGAGAVCPTGRARWRRCTSRVPREEREEGRERLAFEELLLTQLVFLRRRAAGHARRDAPALTQAPSLSERWLSDELPFELTGDQRRAIETIGEDLARERAMQRLLTGRGRQRQDGGRRVGAAARGRARAAGRADGADGDARRAAFRDAAEAARRRARRPCGAHC